MFFYRVEISGYEMYDPRVLVHEKHFTEEEFVSLVDRVALKIVPDAIQHEFEMWQRIHEKNMKELIESEVEVTAIFGSITNAREAFLEEAACPRKLTWSNIFDKVIEILIDEYNFSYLKYNVIVEHHEWDVIGVVPPVLPG